MHAPTARFLVTTSVCLVLGCSEDRTTNNSTVVQTDGVPPDVQITAPLNGQVFRIARNHLWNATATDNAAMASVEFRRDGLTYVVDSTPPYSTIFTPTSFGAPGTHVLTADAYDQAGNRRTSAAVTITTRAGAIAGGPLADVDHSIFGATDGFGLHIEFGYTAIGLLTLGVLLTAVAGGLLRREIGLSLLLLILYVVQTALPQARASAPVIAALHPVNAIVLFTLGVIIARRGSGARGREGSA